MTDRTWIGEAYAAFDQGLTEQAGRDGFPDPSFWISRAQAAASIEQARQARIGNLIAWKQLRQSAPATALASGGDLLTAEIEAALGITDPVPDAGDDEGTR
jgi:hypothetical protein